jgi:hypothetical protein
MENEKTGDQQRRPSRRTLRLTFQITNGKLELIKQERLEKITPPQVGERPKVETHAGFWFELQDAKKRVLAHRIINETLLGSVEVHSPDGHMERKFGDLRDGVFEVLLPDVEDAKSAVLIGTSRNGKKRQTKAGGPASSEIARFDLAERGK